MTHLRLQPAESLDLLFDDLVERGDQPNPYCVTALPNDIGQIGTLGRINLQPDPARYSGARKKAKSRPTIM